METFRSNSVLATEGVAASVAGKIIPGDCIALHGELGAGKTQFVRGLVKAMGGDGRQVSSPTFVLMNVYETPHGSVFHLDAYRASGPDEVEAIGFSELLQQPGVVVVEWAERIEKLLPVEHWSVRIRSIGRNRRRIDVERIGGADRVR